MKRRSQQLRALLRSPLPHGLISWRYLWPGRDERIRRHRLLWWKGRPGWPRPLWLAVELVQWLRWVGFSGWHAIWRAWKERRGEARDGLALSQELWRLTALSIGHCIPPGAVYRFRLHHDPERAWDYVFDSELAAYHHQRNRGRDVGGESVDLLADKWRLSAELERQGIPMAPILACIARGDPTALTVWPTGGRGLFCKGRSGSRGRRAFTVWREADRLWGRGLDGSPLADTGAVEMAWRALLEQDDALIQPCLENHPALAPLAIGEGAVTVRYISRHSGTQVQCLGAILELPAGAHPQSGRPRYLLLPIEPKSGRLAPEAGGFTPEPWEEAPYRAVKERLAPDARVPFWAELATASHHAHRHLPGPWAIAWDWVVTPDGPRLLEGNSGWSVAMPQRLWGGLLRVEACRARGGEPAG